MGDSLRPSGRRSTGLVDWAIRGAYGSNEERKTNAYRVIYCEDLDGRGEDGGETADKEKLQKDLSWRDDWMAGQRGMGSDPNDSVAVDLEAC